MKPVIVFLDTSVLLKAFLAFRSKNPLPDYLTDKTTKKYTFEKCVFEVYMAFRGVGGKKPDEGRGDWAKRHLKQENDPKPIGDLSSQFHGGDGQYSFFWSNQILEFHGNDGLENQEHAAFIQWQQQMEELVSQREKFEMLCNEFYDFLRQSEIETISYLKVFEGRSVGRGFPTPYQLDSFAQETVLPSEDFEIVYAAMTIRPDIFITDDKRLITCAASLGLNFNLSVSNFCESKDYAATVQEIKEFKDWSTPSLME